MRKIRTFIEQDSRDYIIRAASSISADARSFLSRIWVSHTNCLARLVSNNQGTTVIIFALTLPVMLMLVGFSIDYAVASLRQKELQNSLDAAALAAASELNLADRDPSELLYVAQSVVTANLGDGVPSPKLEFSVSTDDATVKLKAVQRVESFFGGVFGHKIETVTAEATAIVVGSTRVCVIALDPKKAGAISLESSARLTGNGCAVYSNSSSAQSIAAKNSARLRSSLTCSAGGYSGSSLNFEPEPLTDCPAFDDPLADRPEPHVTGGCLKKDLQIVDTIATLSPGIYCGGIHIQGASKVTLRPGIYVMDNGPLDVEDTSALIGENVGFYLRGSLGRFKFTVGTEIELSAPEDGDMAGLLFFETRNKTAQGTHSILSNNARLLLGTIYLPKSKLVIDADAPVADQSAYTAIVAREVKLFSGPHLILNTDYSATEVPVPDGIKGMGNQVRLVK